jgi:trehalose 6-phosphate synthase/phosphatase
MSCEHGVFFRPCGEGRDWEMIGAEVAAKWKDLVLPVLQEFASRTPGSMIEVKEVNLSWHYRYTTHHTHTTHTRHTHIHVGGGRS